MPITCVAFLHKLFYSEKVPTPSWGQERRRSQKGELGTESKQPVKWVALALLLALMSVAVTTGTADEPQATEPSAISCGDSAHCSMGGPAFQVVNTGVGPAIKGRNAGAKAAIQGVGRPGILGMSGGGNGVEGSSVSSAGVYGESDTGYGLRARTTNGIAVYAENTTGGDALFLDGDAAQTLQSNGLVKAGVAGGCIGDPEPPFCWIYRSFNNVGGTITVAAVASGQFTVDLGFDVSQRFWVPTLMAPPYHIIGCALGGTPTQLGCGVDYSMFDFMLLVY